MAAASFLRLLAASLCGAVVAASVQEYRSAVPMFPNSTSPVPFHLSVHPDFVRETVAKVGLYRPIQEVFPVWTNEGPNSGNITKLATYWAEEYDWFKVQARLNADYAHFAVTVPGALKYPYPVPLHFIHQPSSVEGATPLLLLHGWPSTFLEWRKVIHPLAAPAQGQGPAFHVVAPDLPGYGFSPAPRHPGLGIQEMAVVFNELMLKLGYKRYGLVTTDVGWFIGNWMAHTLDSISAHFSDFALIEPSPTDYARYAKNQTTPEESAYIEGVKPFLNNHLAYAEVQIQKPAAMGLAMADSPVGFAGWMWDLVYTVSDGFKYSFAELITDAMMLYIPGVYANIRPYKFEFEPAVVAPTKTSVATGYALWAMPDGPYPDIANSTVVPRSWLERAANITYYVRHSNGGHFPAISRPAAWLKDVRTFFSQNG